jgi:hypothetical protein
MCDDELDWRNWEDLVYAARTPDGLEFFVPSGRPACASVTVIVNDVYITKIDLNVGVTSIGRGDLIAAGSIPMPTSEEIRAVKIEFPPTCGFPHFFFLVPVGELRRPLSIVRVAVPTIGFRREPPTARMMRKFCLDPGA